MRSIALLFVIAGMGVTAIAYSATPTNSDFPIVAPTVPANIVLGPAQLFITATRSNGQFFYMVAEGPSARMTPYLMLKDGKIGFDYSGRYSLPYLPYPTYRYCRYSHYSLLRS